MRNFKIVGGWDRVMVGDEKEGRRTSKSWATDRGDRQKECRRTSKSWAADRGEGDKRNAEELQIVS